MTGLYNSVVACGSAVLIGVVLGLPAAYAVARYPNRWAGDIQFFVLSLRFLPPVAVAIPLMVIWLQIGLYDTLPALIVTYSLLTISVIMWLAIPAFQTRAQRDRGSGLRRWLRRLFGLLADRAAGRRRAR